MKKLLLCLTLLLLFSTSTSYAAYYIKWKDGTKITISKDKDSAVFVGKDGTYIRYKNAGFESDKIDNSGRPFSILQFMHDSCTSVDSCEDLFLIIKLYTDTTSGGAVYLYNKGKDKMEIGSSFTLNELSYD